jgi:hypothetical protein
MWSVPRKNTALITAFLFTFLLLVNGFPQYSEQKKSGESLIKKGELLYLNNDFQGALDVWMQAVPRLKDRRMLSNLYFRISEANFRLGKIPRAEEFLRKMFELRPQKMPNEEDLDSDFLIVYNKVKAEYWFHFRVESPEDQKSQQKVIEKLTTKPKKKKRKIWPLLIIGCLIVTAAVVMVLLSNRDTEEYGTLIVRNGTGSTVNVSIGENERALTAFDSIRYFLSAGDYSVEIYDSEHSQTYNVTIIIGETVWLNFIGWTD